MINLENELYNPVFEFLKQKREYFKSFGQIANNKRHFTNNRQNKPQYKNEGWFRAELSVLLKDNKWLVATEVDAIDLCIKKNKKGKDIKIEIKEFINSGRNPNSKADFPHILKDFKKINNFNGLSLILLPKGTGRDKDIEYTKIVFNRIKEECPSIKQIYSRSILYDDEGNEGFWVSWWSFYHDRTEHQELSEEYII